MPLIDGRSFTACEGMVSTIVRRGSGFPILLLHGNSSCSEIFAPIWAELACRDYELIALDLPGHGKSMDAVRPEQTYTLPGYAQIVTEVVSHLGLEHVVVIGWSLGGHIAMEAMLTEPRIAGAMVIGSPPAKPTAVEFQAAFCPDPVTLLAGKLEFSEADAKAYVGAMLGTDEPNEFLIAQARRTDGRARHRLIQSVIEEIGGDQRLAYRDPTRPVAVVVGTNDPFIQMSYFATLQSDTMWGGKVHFLEDEGHAPHWRPREPFRRLLLEFLEQFAHG